MLLLYWNALRIPVRKFLFAILMFTALTAWTFNSSYITCIMNALYVHTNCQEYDSRRLTFSSRLQCACLLAQNAPPHPDANAANDRLTSLFCHVHEYIRVAVVVKHPSLLTATPWPTSGNTMWPTRGNTLTNYRQHPSRLEAIHWPTRGRNLAD